MSSSAPSLALLSDIAIASEHEQKYEHEHGHGYGNGQPHESGPRLASEPFMPGDLVLWRNDEASLYGERRA